MAPTLKQLKKAKWIEDFNENEYDIILVEQVDDVKQQIINMYESDEDSIRLLLTTLGSNAEQRILHDNLTDEDIITYLTKIASLKYYEDDISITGKFINISNINMYYKGIDELYIYRINFNAKKIWLTTGDLA